MLRGPALRNNLKLKVRSPALVPGSPEQQNRTALDAAVADTSPAAARLFGLVQTGNWEASLARLVASSSGLYRPR